MFGKENQYEKSAKGFSDFGGGTDGKETYLQTATREAVEESTGFLGTPADIRRSLGKTKYHIDYQGETGHSNYRMFILPYAYDLHLEYYYNNNRAFIEKKLSPNIIRQSKIFEKESIQWICIDDLARRRKEFRHYFQNIIDLILEEKDEIYDYVRRAKVSP